MIDNTFPLVTIAIPTYNRANCFLKHAIECALKQTYQNVEIVISDNCSSDNTGDIIKSYGDPRVRYFRHQVNIGPNNNFNFCLEKARGAYFLLFHDDDSIDADFIDVCMKSAGHRTDIGVIRTGTRVIDGEGNIKNECKNIISDTTIQGLFFDWFAAKTPIYLCNTLFNTTGLREIGGFRSKTNLYQDVVAEFRLAARYGRLDIPDVKASFRRHLDNRGSSAKLNDWCEDSLHLLNVMCDLAPSERDLILKKGMVYFCKKNYRLASAINSPLMRFIKYFMVYRNFSYVYSPIHFIFSRRGRSLKRLLQRTMKQAESKA